MKGRENRERKGERKIVHPKMEGGQETMIETEREKVREISRGRVGLELGKIGRGIMSFGERR